jgi:YHS domain-containing protein
MNKLIAFASLALVLGLASLRAEDKPAASAYPLTTCIVSGESLTDGDMGGPIKYTYKEEGKPDREIQFCCKMCIGKFKKDPAKYLAKLDAAEAAAKK